MSEQDTSPAPQNNSAPGTPSPSGLPNNQANSNPLTESEKTSNKEGEKTEETEKAEEEESPKNTLRSKVFKKVNDKLIDTLQNINKYITEDNPNLDINEINKKYPSETLASIFWIQKKDRKIILWALLLLFVHTIFYYLKLPQPIEIVRIVIVDLLRITIATTLLIFATKNVCSAYQNRLIIVESFKKYPLQFFTTIIAVGGLFALTIPAVMNVLKLIGDSSALTTAILSITGGFIAVFGLIKSHQKSELEREQLEVQKQKDARDHIRQLHESYNDRFDKAVAELNGSDVKASYAAVPKLAKLADAWLDYKDLSDDKKELKKLKKKAKKEAQTIINILCKYIRTMPGEYTEEDLKDIGALDTTDQDKLKSESEVRRLIFFEMSDRSSKISIKNGETSPGVWSEFNFDFTGAPIFYDLNEIYIEKPNFSDSTFYGKANFSGSTFIQDANFVGAKFTQNVNFCETKFIGNADFRSANFPGFAEFKNVKFREAVNFSGIVFAQSATFRGSRFYGVANFIWTLFKNSPLSNQEVDFNSAKFFQGVSFYRAAFETNAIFENAKFLKNAKFSRVDFSKATLEGEPSFLITNHREGTIEEHLAEFWFFFTETSSDDLIKRIADFGHAIFEKKANFKNVTLGSESDSGQIIDFSNTEFKQGANFTSATFNYKTSFDSSIFNNENDATECASFSFANFRRNADFSSAVFKADVNFRARIFGQEVDFHLATFSGTTDFSDVIFKGYTGFRYVNFETSPPKFVFTTNSGVSCPAKFVAIPEPGEPHDFVVDSQSNNDFDMGITTYKGIDYGVPKGAVVFTYPEDWDEDQQEPTNYSSPAK